MSSNNPKLTVYTIDGCGYCLDQKKEIKNYNNKEIVNCSINPDNKVCKKSSAFPLLNIKGKFYEGLHSMQEILDISKNKK